MASLFVPSATDVSEGRDDDEGLEAEKLSLRGAKDGVRGQLGVGERWPRRQAHSVRERQ